VNLKKSIWKYVSIIFAAFIILNPEMIELALFIDVVGVDLFLLLVEIQLFAIASTLLAPIFMRTKLFYKQYIFTLSSKNFMDTLFKLQIYTQCPATIMYILVASAALNITLAN